VLVADNQDYYVSTPHPRVYVRDSVALPWAPIPNYSVKTYLSSVVTQADVPGFWSAKLAFVIFSLPLFLLTI